MCFLKCSKIAAMFLIGSVAAVAQSNPQGDTMSAYYTSTLVCRSGHIQCHIWFNKDGTYVDFQATVAADGSVRLSGVEGEFKVTSKDGGYQTCLSPHTHDGPPRPQSVECYQLGSHKLGDAWDAMTGDGTAVHFSLESGRHVNAGSDFI